MDPLLELSLSAGTYKSNAQSYEVVGFAYRDTIKVWALKDAVLSSNL